MRMEIPHRLWPTLLACLAIAGCGGDDDDGGGDAATGRDKPPTEAEERAGPAPALSEGDAPGDARTYRRRANALCAGDERAVKALPEPQTPDGLVSYFEKVLALSERSEPRYRALDPPKRLAEAHAAYLETGDEGQRLLRGLIDDLEAGGDPTIVTRRSLPKLARLVDDSNRRARRLGLEDCVEELSPEGAESPESTF